MNEQLTLGDIELPTPKTDKSQIAVTVRIKDKKGKLRGFYGYTPRDPFPDTRHYKVLKVYAGEKQYEVRFNESDTRADFYTWTGQYIGEVAEILNRTDEKRWFIRTDVLDSAK